MRWLSLQAELLYNHKHYARAYFWHLLAWKEFSNKSAADVSASFIAGKEFWQRSAKASSKD